MFGFNFGNKKILGIDIGTSTLKIIELEIRNEKPYLSNYAWMKMPSIKRNGDQEADFFEQTVPDYLKKMIKKARISRTEAYIAIPAFGGLITLIDFPEMPAKDMEQAIKFEAHKYIPTSLDEVTISWEIVGEDGLSDPPIADAFPPVKKFGKKVQVLLVAAPKSKIISYEKLAKRAEIKLAGVEIESISMVEALVGNDKGNFIIADIGCRMCNIIYVEKGIIKANRNIDAGGDDITREISKSLGITRERAEAMKKSEKNFFSMESGIHFSTVDMIAGEIFRILDSVSGKETSPRVDALILSGGTANLNGLRESFESKLKLRTIIGDPFSRLDYDKKLSPIIAQMKGRFAVGVGLALKGVREHTASKNK